MSKPIPRAGIVRLSPTAQVRYLAEVYHRATNPVETAWFAAHVVGCGLHFNAAELTILAALDTPAKVQEFLNTQIYYYDDHTLPGMEETARSPRGVLQTGLAHCFEGALFAYAVNFLHGHIPRLILLEASQDADHNLVVAPDKQTGLYGCNAHSTYPHLDGRAAQYRTLHALVESYRPFYYSDYTRNPNDLTLVGYSEPIDLITKYGVAWIASEKPLWDIYYTYIDDATRFHYLFDDSDATHDYPLIRALKERWLRVDASGKVFISVDDFSPDTKKLWHAFWGTYDPSHPHPRGEARAIEKQFRRLTGTMPLDLRVNAEELEKFLAAGYRVEQIVNSKQ